MDDTNVLVIHRPNWLIISFMPFLYLPIKMVIPLCVLHALKKKLIVKHLVLMALPALLQLN
jgi:hypothetical protein